MPLPTEIRSWVRNEFIISTDKSLLSTSAINAAFKKEFIYWTRETPEDVIRHMIQNSFCLGLYTAASQNGFPSHTLGSERSTSTDSLNSGSMPPTPLKQIGFARLMTDDTTFAYLTDLYVLPEYQGLGLGGWMIDVIGELLDCLPYLRWAMLRTSSQKSQGSYEKRLGMAVIRSTELSEGPIMMGRRGKKGGP